MCFTFAVAIRGSHAQVHRGLGVNISERKSGAEWTKKRKKRELVFFSPPPGVATGTIVPRLDASRILPELR